jgi:hypothetical protein
MKQLIGLVRLGALTAFSVALYGAQRQTQATQATQTSDNQHSKESGRQAGPEGELVLLGVDGTVIAREVNLAPHALLTNSAADLLSASGPHESSRSS